MSDALSYLIKARPEAMTAYFTFLKDTGKHLDPKTRSLISVITKIDAQTERGLRQYLPRAIRDGATPHEVLDAILMAFPTLGLAKIVWAVDIILDMDIPEFRVDLLDAEPSWHDLIAWDEVKENDITYIEKINLVRQLKEDYHKSKHLYFLNQDTSNPRDYRCRCNSWPEAPLPLLRSKTISPR